MKAAACELWPVIGRTVDPRSDRQLSAHLEDCPSCWGALDEVRRAAALVRALPYQAPGPDAREQARTRLVAALDHALPAVRPARRRLWARGATLLAASLCAATVAAAVGTRLLEPEPESDLVGPAPPPVQPRVRGGRPQVLPPEPEVPPAPVAAPVPAPVQRTRPSATRPAPARVEPPPLEMPAPVAPPPVELPAPAAPPIEVQPPAEPPPAATPEELAFNQGWEALRRGDHRGAAAHLERALDLGPGGQLAEDARFWRAVALGRTGAGDEARGAMEEFLRLHPGSPRAGEVSAMLGWLLVDAGDRARARALFEIAEKDGNAGVRRSARAGLKAVGSEP